MAIYSLLNQSEQNTNADFSRMQTNFINGAGVVDLDGGDCEVTENGTPNLSVNVAAGSGYILNDSWTQNSGLVQFVEYENTATENVAINSNPSGNPRITSVFAKFDASANPGTRSDGSVSFVAIDGTASATPSAPAVPSDGNSYDLLAHVTVSNGASTITNSDISDERSQVTLNAQKVGNQVLFMVKTATGQAVSTAAEIVEFNDEVLDIGNNFNTSTYQFTAPIDGYYEFTTRITAANLGDNQEIQGYIYKNGALYVRGKASSAGAGSDPQVFLSAIMDLNTNDTVSTYVEFTTSGNLISNAEFNVFTGKLIAAK